MFVGGGVIFVVLLFRIFFMNFINCFFFFVFFCKLLCSIWVWCNVWGLLLGRLGWFFWKGRGVVYMLFLFLVNDLFINFRNSLFFIDKLV